MLILLKDGTVLALNLVQSKRTSTYASVLLVLGELVQSARQGLLTRLRESAF